MVVLQMDEFMNASLRGSQQFWLEEQLGFPEQPQNCFLLASVLVSVNGLGPGPCRVPNRWLAKLPDAELETGPIYDSMMQATAG
ncbi:hypothetical protein V1508DRAFT_414327 [Lipomyces doorenjongii]|uniref:uncharacterized protein n=1 Tax=Lipomyces doorenjongii TaxID=383834 RepID=UPI0034CDB7BD